MAKREGRLIGYARVSTEDQDMGLQIDALRRAGIPDEQIYREKASERNPLQEVGKPGRSGV